MPNIFELQFCLNFILLYQIKQKHQQKKLYRLKNIGIAIIKCDKADEKLN